MTRREKHRLERYVKFSDGSIHKEHELDFCLPIARKIAAACAQKPGDRSLVDLIALKAAIQFAVVTSVKNTQAFMRKGDLEQAQLSHLTMMEALRRQLHAEKVKHFNVVTESTMAIGYLLYFVPRRLGLARLDIESSAMPLQWNHWVQMARFLEDDAHVIPFDPILYRRYQSDRKYRLSQVYDASSASYWGPDRFASYDEALAETTTESLKRWQWLTANAIDKDLSPSQLAINQSARRFEMTRALKSKECAYEDLKAISLPTEQVM